MSDTQMVSMTLMGGEQGKENLTIVALLKVAASPSLSVSVRDIR